MIHLSRTYSGMVPFLKGIHHTLESWRSNRDEDGWILDGDIEAELDDEFESESFASITGFYANDQIVGK